MYRKPIPYLATAMHAMASRPAAAVSAGSITIMKKALNDAAPNEIHREAVVPAIRAAVSRELEPAAP